ncbi:MAG: SIMPL domain-containing protein [Desulfatibacillum sp.]|nr:SIMPL domain-containing protein [Desulfatibacillum sp.]
MNGKYSLTLFGIVVSIGLIISTYLVTDVIRDVRMSHQIIKVRGYAEKVVESDLATWTIELKTRTKNVVEGYNILEKHTFEVLGFLHSNEINDGEISKTSVSIEERLKKVGYNETNEIEDYELTQFIKVRSNDVYKIARISTQIDTLIKKGVELQSHTPKFSFSKVNDLKSDLLTAATMDARSRAAVLAEGSGVKLGYLRAARQGKFSILSATATNISDDSYSDDEYSIGKKVTAVVTVDYSMK